MVKFDWPEDNIEPAVDSEGNTVVGTLHNKDVIYKEGIFWWKDFSSADIDFIIRYADRISETKLIKKKDKTSNEPYINNFGDLNETAKRIQGEMNEHPK